MPVKRAGNLYEGIYSTANLWLALHRALRGKRGSASARRFLSACKQNLRILQQRLRDRQWFPGPYSTFTIFEPKERVISAAPFADRVAHHAIMNIIEPFFEKFSIHDSYACRRGKGLHAAIARSRGFQRGHKYFLKLDIKKYFESIDHGILKARLARLFKDAGLLELLARIIDSSAASPGRGVPIGNLTSQHFANFYLGYLDHFVKDELSVKGYVRYMDDFCLWDNSKDSLKEKKAELEQYLAGHLNLRLKETATRLAPCTYGMPFLGFRLFPQTIRLKRETLRRFAAKVKFYDYLVRHGYRDALKTSQAMESIYSFIHTANCTKFLKNYAAAFAV
jgi:retron-type reverse transcriptase